MVIGCGQIKPHGDMRELASIAVSPEYRSQGVARALVENLLANSSRPLYLMCMSHNGPLYERFGFRSVAQDQMPRYFQRIHKLFKLANMVRQSGEDLLVMKLE
jgi:N-acetylglutamate synthase-like GNAT family acetyltransferase